MSARMMPPYDLMQIFCTSMSGKVAAMLLVTWFILGTGDWKMVATIPTEMAPFVLAAIIALAVVFGMGVMLRRYVEHNEKDGFDRGSNKLKVKFIAGTVIAIAVVSAISYFLAPILTAWIGLVDPAWYEYVLIILIPEIFLTIGAVLVACEGLTFTAKWVEQKAKEVKDVAKSFENLSDEDKAKVAALLEAFKDKKDPPQDGLA